MKRTMMVTWSDPAELAERGRSMPGIEFLRAIRDRRLPAAPIAALLGFDLIEVEPGHAVFEVNPGEQHYNPIGVVHGGLAMTLLDSAMGCAVQTHMPAGGGYTTELLARAVGPTGKVLGQNTSGILKAFAGKAWAARLAKPVNRNIQSVVTELEEAFPPGSDLDLVVNVLFYHDTYWLGTDRARMRLATFEHAITKTTAAAARSR